MTLSAELSRLRRERGEQLAIAFDGRIQLTFAELDHAASQLADALLSFGLQHGDRVAVLLRNRPEYVISYFGLARAGLVIVPANRRASPSEVSRIVADAQARVLITESGYESVVQAVRLSCPNIELISVDGIDASAGPAHRFATFVRGGDGSFAGRPVLDGETQAIHYTSGTTGTARGVVRTHRANLAVALGTLDAVPVQTGEVWFYTLPMHSVGIYAFLIAPLLGGGSVVFTEHVDPELTLDLVARYQAVMLHAVPTVWEMLMRGNSIGDSNRLSSVKSAFWGGSPLPRGTAERLEHWMRTPCLGCYGSTEAPCITFSKPDIYRSGRFDSSGPFYGSMMSKIVDDSGNVLAAGEMGEVLLKGPALMSGYFNKPDLTAKAIDDDGWYHTGDWGRVDADGALTVTDRKKDMIISGGENVYPGEVENAISTVEGVSEVSVVGVADDLWGQVIWAFIVTDGRTVSTDSVVEACRSRLAGFKTPRQIRFIGALPTNTTGKVQKDRLLLLAEEEGRQQPPSQAPVGA